MLIAPPIDPTKSIARRPNLSTKKSSQTIAPRNLIIPKIPVVNSEVLVPVTPIDLKMVCKRIVV